MNPQFMGMCSAHAQTGGQLQVLVDHIGPEILPEVGADIGRHIVDAHGIKELALLVPQAQIFVQSHKGHSDPSPFLMITH